MALIGAHALGATPLTADDVLGLKLPATTHGELNVLEAQNIVEGWRWAVRSTKSRMPNMLTDSYVRELRTPRSNDGGPAAGKALQAETTSLGRPRAWSDRPATGRVPCGGSRC